MIAKNDILGVILAGGLATRMGGGDKGRLSLGQTTLIQSVIERITPQVARLVLNANGDPARFADLSLPVVTDSIHGHPGPLAGVLAGMDYATNLGFSHVLSVAADTPFLPTDLAQKLSAVASPIAIAATELGGETLRQPVIGLWPTALREDLRKALTNGVSKVMQWAGPHGVGQHAWPAQPLDPFLNVNTPEDLERARLIAKHRADRPL